MVAAIHVHPAAVVTVIVADPPDASCGAAPVMLYEQKFGTRTRLCDCVIITCEVQVSSIVQDNGTGILISGRDRIQQAVRCYLSNPVRFTKVDCPRTFQCDTAC